MEAVMAKSQIRSSKEKKKPKAEWNKKKKGGPAAPGQVPGQLSTRTVHNPYGKKP